MPTIRILETIEEMEQLQRLQNIIWPGSEIDLIPTHLLITFAHQGGLVLGAYEGDEMIGLLVGFPGIEQLPDGPQPKHCSHELGIHPGYRNAGLGFALKRAQWQYVRQQGIDHITWTYDPLLSVNASLNIARLGGVCQTYLREVYGQMRDGLNAGLPSDRFQVDWWLNTPRVNKRMGNTPRTSLTLEHYLTAHSDLLYSVTLNSAGLQTPPDFFSGPASNLALVEIPPDFLSLKAADLGLAAAWKYFTRSVFETCFTAGYLVTDFLYDTHGDRPRSLYVLTKGDSQLG